MNRLRLAALLTIAITAALAYAVPAHAGPEHLPEVRQIMAATEPDTATGRVNRQAWLSGRRDNFAAFRRVHTAFDQIIAGYQRIPGPVTPAPTPQPVPSGPTLFIAGDSISVCNQSNGGGDRCDLNWTYAGQYQVAHSDAAEYGFARGGSGLPWLGEQREAMLLRKPVSGPWAVSVLIGANDLAAAASGQDYFNRLVAITDPLRAAGAKVIIGTVLPTRDARHNANRAALNTLLRGAVDTRFDAVADFAADARMGPDSAAADPALYSDGVHPTGAGHTLLVPIFKGAVDRALGLVVTPPPVTAPPPSDGFIAAPSLTGLAPVASNFDVSRALVTSWPTGPGNVVGAFRMTCTAGHLNYDDALLYPGQAGRAHLHQYFGNLLADANSTFESLRTTGDSTCNLTGEGVSANRSAYWMPAMLDGKGNVVRPDYASVYYKRRPLSDPIVSDPTHPQFYGKAVGLPNGLRFIMGWNQVNPANTNPGSFDWKCDAGPDNGRTFTNMEEALANCPAGAGLYATVRAPDCWNGTQLSGAEHRNHLSYPLNTGQGFFRCPATHPYVIPAYQLTARWEVDGNKDTWVLSSDYMLPGGRRGATFHADFFEAWDAGVKKVWEDNCINRLLDCTGGALGDGRMLKGATGAPWKAEPRLVPVPANPTRTTRRK